MWWHQHFNHIRSVRQLIIKLRENLQLTDLHYQLLIPLLLMLLMTTMNISVQTILTILLKTLRQLLLIIRKSLNINNYSYNAYNKKLSMKTIRESSESSIYTSRKALNSLSWTWSIQGTMQVLHMNYNIELQQTLHLSHFSASSSCESLISMQKMLRAVNEDFRNIWMKSIRAESSCQSNSLLNETSLSEQASI